MQSIRGPGGDQEGLLRSNKAFVVVSGIPGCGKTTLARQLEPLLEFTVIDKDDVLEQMLVGAGDHASARRRELSRESDVVFQRLALQADRAILVSFWHVPGMRADSGTPIDWLTSGGHSLVHVRCHCPPALAVNRFLDRTRHPGHGDLRRSRSELAAEFEQLAAFGSPALTSSLDVDTGAPVDVAVLATRIRLNLAVP